MTTLLEQRVYDAAATVCNVDRDTVAAWVANPPEEEIEGEGSILVVLMVVSIILTATRLILDHCWDNAAYVRHASSPNPLVRRYVKQVVRRTCRNDARWRDIPYNLSAEQVAEAVIDTARGLGTDELLGIAEEYNNE